MKSKDKNEMQLLKNIQGFPSGSVGKEFIYNARNPLQCRKPGFHPWVGKIPWKREWIPIPVFWPGKFNGLYSPWGRKESDMTEQLSLHFPSYISW